MRVDEHIYGRMDIPLEKYMTCTILRACPVCGKKMTERRISDGFVTQSAWECAPCEVVLVPSGVLEAEQSGSMPCPKLPSYESIEEVDDETTRRVIASRECPECRGRLDHRVRLGVETWECRCGFVLSSERLPDSYESRMDSIVRGVCPRCEGSLEWRLVSLIPGVCAGAWACVPCDVLCVPTAEETDLEDLETA